VIILDTNVISEPVRSNPSANVLAWLNREDHKGLFLTAISLAEILSGFALMPKGKRRNDLSSGMQSVIEKYLGSRILPFDASAARAYAELIEAAKISGRLLSEADAQIAAIVRAQRCVIATRDTAPFLAAGVEVINPWDQL
jgi:toxin FitB